MVTALALALTLSGTHAALLSAPIGLRTEAPRAHCAHMSAADNWGDADEMALHEHIARRSASAKLGQPQRVMENLCAPATSCTCTRACICRSVPPADVVICSPLACAVTRRGC